MRTHAILVFTALALGGCTSPNARIGGDRLRETTSVSLTANDDAAKIFVRDGAMVEERGPRSVAIKNATSFGKFEIRFYGWGSAARSVVEFPDKGLEYCWEGSRVSFAGTTIDVSAPGAYVLDESGAVEKRPR